MARATSVHVCGPLLAGGFDPATVAQPQFVSALYMRGTQFGRKDKLYELKATLVHQDKTICVQARDISLLGGISWTLTP
jgi:hypothetical protein